MTNIVCMKSFKQQKELKSQLVKKPKPSLMDSYFTKNKRSDSFIKQLSSIKEGVERLNLLLEQVK